MLAKTPIRTQNNNWSTPTAAMGLLAIDKPPTPTSHKYQRAESVCSTSSKRGDRLTRPTPTSHKYQRAESVCSTSSKRGDRLTRPTPTSHKYQRAESVCSTSSKRRDRLNRAMGTRTEEERERYLEHARQKRRNKERAKAMTKSKSTNKRNRVETIMHEDSPAKMPKSLPDITQSMRIQPVKIPIPTYQAPKGPLPEPRHSTYAGITLNNQQKVTNASAFESVVPTAARVNIYSKSKEVATTSTAYKVTTNNRKQTRPFLRSTHFFTVISDKADITAEEIDQVLLGCKENKYFISNIYTIYNRFKRIK